MFKLAIDNGIAVAVATLIICVLGLAAMFRIPVQMIPDMEATTVTVITGWPGATPQDIEREIIIEQEDYLRSLPNLQEMISEAKTGEATIELEFALGSDLNEVLIRVNNALSQVSDYPENVDQPRIITTPFSSNAFMFFVVSPLPGNPQQVDITMQRDFIKDNVATALERTPGVSEVQLNGGAERQIRIYLDPSRLAERQITLGEVRQALRNRNRDVSGGDLDSGKRRYLLRTVGRFQDIESINDTLVVTRNGIPVYLRDLGHAELSHAEIRATASSAGVDSLMLMIKRQLGSNVIDVMDGVMATTEQLQTRVLEPQGMQMVLIGEDVKYVRDGVQVVSQNLAIGAVLAVLVLFLFLRAPAPTLIGAVGIPICAIAAFIGLILSGRTINVISLAGVAFALGMTLDNSIVVLESIDQRLRTGMQRKAAALAGVTDVWTAVLASSLTTVLVFLPVLFVHEEAGQLYSDVAIAISSAIFFSMLVSVTLVPAASARFITAPAGQLRAQGLLSRLGQGFNLGVTGLNQWLSQGVIRRLVLVTGVLLLALSIVWALTPKAEYLPEGEEPVTFSFLFPPPGYNLAQMQQYDREINQWLAPYVDVDPGAYGAGEAAVPSLSMLFSFASADMIMLGARTTRTDEINDLMAIIVSRFSQYPGMFAFSTRGSIISGNDGGTRSVELEISGPDLEPLFAAGGLAFVTALQALDNPQIRPAPSSLTLGQPMLEIHPDWERAADLGITAEELGYLMWAYTDGAYVDDFYLADKKLDMFLYSSGGSVRNPDDLRNLPIYSSTGGIVPLSAVARIEESVNTEVIRRVDGERTITLSIISPRDVPLETAVEIIQRDVIEALHQSGQIADSISMEIVGASDKLQATRSALASNLILAVVLSYLLMVAIFRHWGYPLLIMLTVPLGLGGGILGLWLMNLLPSVNQPFDMITMLGFLVLVGIVVNNPILLVTRALDNTRKGMAVAEAVLESTRTRIRPILMTTLTTIGGLAPLVFIPRAGTELYRGLGIIVLFGLLFSTLLTLTFMPALLSLLLQLGERWGARKRLGAA